VLWRVNAIKAYIIITKEQSQIAMICIMLMKLDMFLGSIVIEEETKKER
jgi:hypothetical protein